MDRLTTDKPSTNLMTALNLFYAKDGQAWVRGGGPEPDYKDCTLDDYIWATMCGVLDPGVPITRLPDEDIGELMADWLMDGHCCIPGLIAHLYTAGWAFAELRARLKKVEDILGDTYDLDHLRELMAAEREGRLLVLPCPIGTPVYVHEKVCSSGGSVTDCRYGQDCPRHNRPCPQRVVKRAFSLQMRGKLGKTFWLTKEDAESAIPPERRN